MTVRPIFITASGRSGTSVLTWALGQHPNIITTPETNWLTALASSLDGYYAIGQASASLGHLGMWGVSRASFLREFGIAVDGIVRRTFEARFPHRHTSLEGAIRHPRLHWFRSLDDPKKRWVDGTPSSAGYAGVLSCMFPEARFINLVRDPADVVRSWMAAQFRAPELGDANALLAHVYHSQRAGYLTHAALGKRAMRVVFEQLSSDPRSVLGDILNFLDEDYAPACAEPFADKINSSGNLGAEVMEEFASIASSPWLAEMNLWYSSAADPDWRIEQNADEAHRQLAEYARYRIRMPDLS